MKMERLPIRFHWKNLHVRWPFSVLGILVSVFAAPGFSQDLESFLVKEEQESLESFWIGCENKECHPSVGSLFKMNFKFSKNTTITETSGVKKSETRISGSSDLDRCSLSLIATDQILTNAHCLPEGVKVGNGLERTYAIFPATVVKNGKGESRPIERVRVTKVLQVSAFDPNAKMSPDYAILQLAKPILNRPVLKLVAQPFVDGESYQVVAMWPLKETATRKRMGALQRTQSCQSFSDTIIQPYGPQETQTFFTLFGCSAMKGNSGSPIFNKVGEIVGVLAQGDQGVEIPGNQIVPTFASSQAYTKYAESFSDLKNTPKFWLSGTTATCIFRGAGCTAVITDKDEEAGRLRMSEAISSNLSRMLEDVAGLARLTGPEKAFYDDVEAVQFGDFPKVTVEMTSKPVCASYDYFVALRNKLGPSAQSGFETQVPYATRKWVVSTAVGPDWKLQYRVSPEAVLGKENITLKIAPRGEVSKKLPDGNYESFGVLCRMK